MPEKKKEFEEPASGESANAANASTAAPEADQIADDTDEPCSCCGHMMHAVSNAKRPSKRGGQ